MSVSTSNISSTATYFSGAVLARKGVGATATINVSGHGWPEINTL